MTGLIGPSVVRIMKFSFIHYSISNRPPFLESQRNFQKILIFEVNCSSAVFMARGHFRRKIVKIKKLKIIFSINFPSFIIESYNSTINQSHVNSGATRVLTPLALPSGTPSPVLSLPYPKKGEATLHSEEAVVLLRGVRAWLN